MMLRTIENNPYLKAETATEFNLVNTISNLMVPIYTSAGCGVRNGGWFLQGSQLFGVVKKITPIQPLLSCCWDSFFPQYFVVVLLFSSYIGGLSLSISF